ncbi:hypothetical protein I553_0186 [Mycobacterium xenopi 4042]|uniref:Uncharacterized protein n=1 Tax=Mycobacterium xenopi 4042 TaxID=1299334 RepID=X7YHP7_MYCXE|nr:hypothetical protein I553_0186 [Mycobacterium xenopi 4042]
MTSVEPMKRSNDRVQRYGNILVPALTAEEKHLCALLRT